MEKRFGNNLIKKFIKSRINNQKTVRILEIGFGEGKCLLDLNHLFKNKIELHGISEKKTLSMSNQRDFIKNAKKFRIPISRPLPRPHFYDIGEGIKFKRNFFDIVLSQAAFHYIGNKAKLIEEIWRVLKPRGRAFIHFDIKFEENYPDFMKTNPETPRFIIYKKNKVIKFSQYIKKYNKKYNIRLTKAKNNPDQYNLLINKNRISPLNLKLEYDGNSTIYLTKLKGTDRYKKDSSAWWGTRSVFNTK